MPLSTGHKNKMKHWRKTSPGSHKGRSLRYQFDANKSSGASLVLIKLLMNAGIKMPTLDSYVEIANKMIANNMENQNATV